MSRSKAGRARRDALVGAAQRAMLEHGADTKLRHVAEAAGLTSGAVLYHFPDVSALLLEANRAGMERFYDERVAALATIDDPAERLVVTVRTGLPVDGQDAAVRLLCELAMLGKQELSSLARSSSQTEKSSLRQTQPLSYRQPQSPAALSPTYVSP